MSGQPINTLSEVTLVFCINSDLEMHHTVTVCDVRFPGDILLGMDFFRRTTFSLSSRSQDDSAWLTLEGQEFHVNYTDAQSLQLSVVRVTTPEVPENAEESRFSPSRLSPPDISSAVHLYRTTELPAHSGRFLEGAVARSCSDDGDVLFTPQVTAMCISPFVLSTVSRRRCPVWAVNSTTRPIRLTQGTCLGMTSAIEAVFTAEISASETSDSSACNSACPDLSDDQREDEDFQWEEDQFDRTFGIEDFGYGSTATDVADDLPPSQALAAIEAANIPDYPLPLETEYQMPDLDHLGEDQRQELLRLLGSYSTLFDGGKDAVDHIPGIQHRIDTGQATPVCTRQWRLPQATRQTIRKQCYAMLKNGVIESSTLPWLSPVVLVKKMSHLGSMWITGT